MAVSCFSTRAVADPIMGNAFHKSVMLAARLALATYDLHFADHVVAKAIGNSRLNRSREYEYKYCIASMMFERDRNTHDQSLLELRPTWFLFSNSSTSTFAKRPSLKGNTLLKADFIPLCLFAWSLFCYLSICYRLVQWLDLKKNG